MPLPALERLILDKSPTGYCVYRADGTVVWTNATLQKSLGSDCAHIDAFPPEIGTWLQSRAEYAIEANDPTEKSIIFRNHGTVHIQPTDPKILSADWLATFSSLNQISSRENMFYDTVFATCPIPMFLEDFSVVYRYIERKRAEGVSDFRQYFEENTDVVQKMADLVIVKDANPAVTALTKAPRDTVVGRLSKTMHSCTFPAFIEELVALAEGKKHLEIESPVATPNSSLSHSRIYINFPDDPRYLTNVFVTIIDIEPYLAECRTLEEERAQAQAASKDKSDFVATLSHEMRTPLNGIVGFTELLSEENLNATSREFTQSILACSRTLQHLINDVLDSAKIEAGEMQIRQKPFTLSKIIKDIVQVYSVRLSTKDINFSYHIASDLAPVYLGDPLRISQILNNLLSNAEKFTKNGSISLTIEHSTNGNGLQFLVRDTGIGIDEQAVKQVFEPYKQAEAFTFENYGGTGLGLAISLQFAEMMQGSLHIEPSIPYGTLAILRLPLEPTDQEEDSSTEPPRAELKNLPVEPIRVLAVDDNKVNLRLITHLMKHRNIAVDTALSGEAAIYLLNQQSYDAVLMDLQMPGWDGFETTRRIRKGEGGEHHVDIPIAAVTAHTSEANRTKSKEYGMETFITKPMKPAEIFKFLDNIIQKK